MKMMTVTLAAALMLTGCAEDSDNYKDDSLSIEKQEISKLYEGYEELQGKNFGTFRMPEHIEPQSIEKVYTLTADVPFEIDDSQKEKEARETFKAFLKDDYDESALTKTPSVMNIYRYSDKNGAEGSYYEGAVSICTGKDVPNKVLYDSDAFEFEATYFAEKDGDKEIDFGTDKATVRELADYAEGVFNGNVPAYSDYHARPYYINVQSNKYGVGRVAEIEMVLEYEGVPFERMTPYSKSSVRDDVEIDTYYSFLTASVSMNGRDSATRLGTSGLFNIKSKTECTELITLGDACEILKSGLAEYLDYEIFDVKLKYVNLFDQEVIYMKELSESEQKELFRRNCAKERVFEPEWVFSVMSGEGQDAGFSYIKVNAVTGEIEMDLRTDIRQ